MDLEFEILCLLQPCMLNKEYPMNASLLFIKDTEKFQHFNGVKCCRTIPA